MCLTGSAWSVKWKLLQCVLLDLKKRAVLPGSKINQGCLCWQTIPALAFKVLRQTKDPWVCLASVLLSLCWCPGSGCLLGSTACYCSCREELLLPVFEGKDTELFRGGLKTSFYVAHGASCRQVQEDPEALLCSQLTLEWALLAYMLCLCLQLLSEQLASSQRVLILEFGCRYLTCWNGNSALPAALKGVM